MSHQKSFLTCSLGAVLLVLSACIPVQTVAQLPKTASPTNKPAAIETINIPTVESTFTPTITPTTTIVPTPMPTLSKEDAYGLMTDMLHNNGGCQLPCWWGLIPGKSTHLDAYRELIAFSSIDSGGFLNALDPMSGEVDIDYTKDELFIGINIFTKPGVDKNTLRMVRISTQALNVVGNSSYEDAYGAPTYNELLRAYSLSEILSKYGSPTQVLVRADIYNNQNSSLETFEITLLYPERGIFVRYRAHGERKSHKISGCPSKAFVELWLLSPDDKNFYHFSFR